MTLPIIISIISTIVWIFPAIKQYKSDYFYFFLILGLLDTIKAITFFLLHMKSQYISIVFLFLLISSLASNNKQRYFFIILSLLSIVIYFGFSLQRNTIMLIQMGIHVIIVIILINSFVKHIQKVKAVNLFLILLITYELITVLKYLAAILSYEQGLISFYIATIIQIFFGIAFLFISFKTKDFPILVKD